MRRKNGLSACRIAILALACAAPAHSQSGSTVSSAILIPSLPFSVSSSIVSGANLHYRVPLSPPWTSSVTVTLSPLGSNDVDLFVGTCSCLLGQTNATVMASIWTSTRGSGLVDSITTGDLTSTVGANAIKALFIRVNGYSTGSFTLTVGYTGATPSPSPTPTSSATRTPAVSGALAFVTPVSIGATSAVTSLSSSTWAFFSIPVTSTATFTVYLNALSGDPDLYLSLSPPTGPADSSYFSVNFATSSRGGSDSIIVYPTGTFSTMYVGVRPYSPCTFTLSVYFGTGSPPAGTPSPSPTRSPTPSASLTPGVASVVTTSALTAALLSVGDDIGWVWSSTSSLSLGSVVMTFTCTGCPAGTNFGVRASTSSNVLVGSSASYFGDEAGLPFNGTRSISVLPSFVGETWFIRIYAIAFPAGVTSVSVNTLVAPAPSSSSSSRSSSSSNVGAIVGGVVGGVVFLFIVIALGVVACTRAQAQQRIARSTVFGSVAQQRAMQTVAAREVMVPVAPQPVVASSYYAPPAVTAAYGYGDPTPVSGGTLAAAQAAAARQVSESTDPTGAQASVRVKREENDDPTDAGTRPAAAAPAYPVPVMPMGYGAYPAQPTTYTPSMPSSFVGYGYAAPGYGYAPPVPPVGYGYAPAVPAMPAARLQGYAQYAAPAATSMPQPAAYNNYTAPPPAQRPPGTYM